MGRSNETECEPLKNKWDEREREKFKQKVFTDGFTEMKKSKWAKRQTDKRSAEIDALGEKYKQLE